MLIENREHQFYLRESLYKKYKKSAQRWNREFHITPEDIETKWIEQKGRCAVTNLKLAAPPDSDLKHTTWSIDRIDNHMGYLPNNIRLVHKAYNMFKGSKTDEEIKLMSYLIMQSITTKEYNNYNRLSEEQINEKIKLLTRFKR